MWPTPKLDEKAERKRYETEFGRMKDDFADIDFAVDEVIASPNDVRKLADKLKGVDGILAIHMNMGTAECLKEILATKKPTVLFALPYSGHEWTASALCAASPRVPCLSAC